METRRLNHVSRARLAALLLLAGAAVMPSVIAQPAGAQPEKPATQDSARAQADATESVANRTAIKSRLERRLAEVQRIEQRMKTALEKLESGAPTGQVLRELGGPGRLGGFGAEDGLPEGPPGGDNRAGGRGEGMPRGDGEFRRLTPEERERVAEFLRERLPELNERVATLRSIDEKAADRLLETLAPRLREAFFTYRRDPGSFELLRNEMEAGVGVFDATLALRAIKLDPKADPEKIEEARQRLRAALSAQMDARLALQQRRVESVEQELRDMKARLDDIRSRRELLIDERLAANESFIAGGKPDAKDDPFAPQRRRDGRGLNLDAPATRPDKPESKKPD